VKDLNYLNRDLSKVVAIDTNPEVYSENPDNAIIIPKWKGDSHDTGLVGLIPFLESMAFLQLPDVRAAIKPMAGKNVALEFAKHEAESKRQQIEAWHSSRKPVSTKSLGQMFGLTTSSSNDVSQPPPTFLEQRRKEAQQKYQEFRDYLIKYGPQIRQQQEEERERQMKEMSGSMWGMLAGAPGKPEDSSTGEKSNSAK
jgi:import inner membrane translocase subunit TIM50